MNLLKRILPPAIELEVDDLTGGGQDPPPVFVDGWYAGAQRAPAHPGRVGGPITPWGVTLHETQMHPDRFEALLRRVERSAGRGNCYHFLVGRTPDQGLWQQVPITRNGNHAGGPTHGTIQVASTRYHPNRATVGIELHCAGPLTLVKGQWRTVVDGVARGAAIPSSEVAMEGSRGVHRPTTWQLERCAELVRALHETLPAPPDACRDGASTEALITSVSPGPRTGFSRGSRLFTHRELDPGRKSDPSLEVVRYFTALGY